MNWCEAWEHSEKGRGGESACDHTHNPRSESDETSQYNENKLSRREQQQQSGEEGVAKMKGASSREADEGASAAFHTE